MINEDGRRAVDVTFSVLRVEWTRKRRPYGIGYAGGMIINRDYASREERSRRTTSAERKLIINVPETAEYG